MYPKATSFKGIFSFFLTIIPFLVDAQAITGIITDLNGYWKSNTTNLNPIKPNTNHNLLAFSYNGTQYSTGVNNELLSNRGETFVACDFWSLPVASISSAVNGNTKIGLGSMYDGVANGPSNPTPENNIPLYLTDGTKGLNIGTCVANLPSGTMDFFASSIDPNAIGDGIPDIVVTQVADPSGSFDRYEFITNAGVRVGNYKDIVFTSITPVGTWTADFYEANQNPMTLSPGFTQTDRPIRLWAADLSEFGLTASNIGSISKFRINLCGNSDVAFVAYNHQSFRVATILPLSITSFTGSLINNQPKLEWKTTTQTAGSKIQIERSKDGRYFESIGSIDVKNNLPSSYSYTDETASSGIYYYRLKLVDEKQKTSYSSILQLNLASSKNFKAFKAGNSLFVAHPSSLSGGKLCVYYSSGAKVLESKVTIGSTQTSIPLNNLMPGMYIVVLEEKNNKTTTKLLID